MASKNQRPAKRPTTAHDKGAAPASTRGQRKKAAKAKLSKAGKIAFVAVACAAMLLSVSAMACSGFLNETSSKPAYELTGGVAATVNGVNIKEDTITKEIMSRRTSLGYDDDAAWAGYLADQGLTPETYRKNLIDGYARQHLLAEAEAEYDIKVTQEDVDAAWDETVASYGGDEAALKEMLEQIGYTEDTYRESLKSSLAQQKLKEAVAPAKEPTDEEIVTALNEQLSTYNDARRSSHILIKVAEDATEDEDAKAKATAQEALDKINSGEMTFAEAAKKYSEDTSKDDGGDVGWDKLTTFVTEYQDALNALSKGQVSGIVKSTYGYHIITCTDQFHVDGSVTSLDGVPAEIKDAIVTSLENKQVGSDYNTWLNEYVEQADIVINDMPEEVPYNVDMSLADAAADGDGAEGTDAAGTDGAADAS